MAYHYTTGLIKNNLAGTEYLQYTARSLKVKGPQCTVGDIILSLIYDNSKCKPMENFFKFIAPFVDYVKQAAQKSEVRKISQALAAAADC